MGEPHTTLIDGARILCAGRFNVGSILVRGRHIAAVEYDAEARQRLAQHAAEHIAANHNWLIPGLIDAHAHAYATVLRGSENSLPLELWALFTVAYGRALDQSALRAAVLLCCWAQQSGSAAVSPQLLTIHRSSIWPRPPFQHMKPPV
jgi:cytosine/adenosine deaminase-related metal-dependent hydrolase